MHSSTRLVTLAPPLGLCTVPWRDGTDTAEQSHTFEEYGPRRLLARLGELNVNDLRSVSIYLPLFNLNNHFHFQNKSSTYLLNKPPDEDSCSSYSYSYPLLQSLLLTPSCPLVSSGGLFDMALPMSIDEQRALLTSIAEIATLGRLVLSVLCKVRDQIRE